MILMLILMLIWITLLICIAVFYNKEINEYFTEASRYVQSACTNLGFSECLQTSQCGWLKDGYVSRCLQGTPIGPLNPKLQPDAENSPRGNIQYGRWIFSHPNPFIFC